MKIRLVTYVHVCCCYDMSLYSVFWVGVVRVGTLTKVFSGVLTGPKLSLSIQGDQGEGLDLFLQLGMIAILLRIQITCAVS